MWTVQTEATMLCSDSSSCVWHEKQMPFIKLVEYASKKRTKEKTKCLKLIWHIVEYLWLAFLREHAHIRMCTQLFACVAWLEIHFYRAEIRH